MKKLLIIGAIALVVVGCVLAAGCTSNTSTPATTTEDFAVGTWTLPNGTTVVFGENFKGVMTTGDKTFNFTWKKTTDGKYQVDREDGAQVIWTLDKNKGIMTNADGSVLTKKLDGTSGTAIRIGGGDEGVNPLFSGDENREGAASLDLKYYMD